MIKTTKDFWGNVNGKDVFLFTMTDDSGAKAQVTNFGAVVVSVIVPDKQGALDDVVLGYDDLDGYINGNSSHGAVVGRYANRIAGGQFTLNGQVHNLPKNDGDNCLHGGADNYGRRIWDCVSYQNGKVVFGLHSPDGDAGFPGALDITVEYGFACVESEYRLSIDYHVQADRDTYVNLTNHAYFNLGGVLASPESVLRTRLTLCARRFTPVNRNLIPVDVALVSGTPFDFTAAKPIGADIDVAGGYDHNFLIDGAGLRAAAFAAEPHTGRTMTVLTDMPAIQLYTGNGLNEMGKDGVRYGRYSAFCLETQFTPNTPNLPMSGGFPTCLTTGRRADWRTVYAFGTEK
jgi:aldose 1-epimerase